ncbi:hypothetical protein [Rhizobium leguminosarum]|uniref:hypothetical protein n=1 Tax=Rhizobium leguminosarum TaxID=384 RepID=UPI003F9E9624
MKKPFAPGSSSEAPPTTFPEVTPRPADMPAYTTQMIFEMQHALGRMESDIKTLSLSFERAATKLEQAIEKLDSSAERRLEKSDDAANKRSDRVEAKVSALETKALFLTGFVAAVIVLVPVSAGLVWWSLGERIEQVLHIPQAPPQKP